MEDEIEPAPFSWSTGLAVGLLWASLAVMALLVLGALPAQAERAEEPFGLSHMQARTLSANPGAPVCPLVSADALPTPPLSPEWAAALARR